MQRMNDYQQSNSIMRVAVGVVAFSGMDTLRVCLDSLLRQDYDDSVYDAEFKVIINDKKKYDIPGLMESYPDVEFIVPPRNTGYAGAI